MKPLAHRPELYTAGPDETSEALHSLRRIAELSRQTGELSLQADSIRERNWWTTAVDALLLAIWRYARPLHWAWVIVGAVAVFVYARLVALTINLTVAGERLWPEVPAPCILVMWHGCANAWLVVVAARRVRSPMAIMVARDPRGDCLALVCRLLGLRVVRGGRGKRGWEALAELAAEIERGTCAVLTADGGGPALVAKPGAAALSSATGTPVLFVGTYCQPAISEPHKWDRARTPLPFGRVAIALGPPATCPALTDPSGIESARNWLQDGLDEITAVARRAAAPQTNQPHN